jgi:hypothetical protein
MSKFAWGVTRHLVCEVRNSAGTIVDPTTIQFKYKAPYAATVTYTYPTDTPLKKADTGIYYVDLYFPIGGKWGIQFITTGPDGAEQEEFEIEHSVV